MKTVKSVEVTPDALDLHGGYLRARRAELARLYTNVDLLSTKARSTNAAKRHMFGLMVSDRLNRVRIWGSMAPTSCGVRMYHELP